MGHDGEEKDSCSYTLIPERWEAKHDSYCKLGEDQLQYLEQEDARGWSCPHEASDGEQQCLFHRPVEEKDDEAVAEALVQTVIETSDDVPHRARRRKEFIGARFGDLELPYAVFDADDNYPIDFRHARVEGALNLQHAILRHPIHLDGLHAAATTECQHLRVEGYVHASNAVFEDGLNLLNATFDSDANFIEARINEDIECQHASLGGDADFSGITVDGDLMIAKASVGGVTSLSKADIRGRVLLDGGHFADNVWFLDADIREEVYLHNALFGADMRFVDADIGGVLSFRGSAIEGDLRFDGTALDDPRVVSLRGAHIDDGTLHQPAEPVVFDLTDATVGDVSLGWSNEEAEDSSDLFEHLLVRNTDFDGFDFSVYHDSLTTADWQIHTLARDVDPADWVDDPKQPPTASDMETTYLKAKNGADLVGDQKAAGKFFRWEMIWRRRWTRNRDTSSRLQRARAWKDWAANGLFGLIAGHGERPRRVVAFSLAIIAVFTGVFAAGWGRPSPPYGHPAGYLILSIESFVTLVLGGSAKVNDPWWIRLLAEAEGFAGIFLVALFVFTLTRSVHR